MPRTQPSESPIRLVLASTCALTLAVTVVPSSIGASVSTLKHRAHRQQIALHRWSGTRTFFANHPRQAASRVGRQEMRKATIWLRVLREELAETRAALTPKVVRAVYSAQASWYGPGFYGNRTACGDTLTTSLMGVAHKTMACGTRLVVCYRGRCANVTVVDRGPYVAGRDFDLTGALAVYLGFGGVGTVTWSPQ